MNAITYIQQHGVEKAREVVSASANALVQCEDNTTFHVDDLQRLVESVDYLNEWYEGKIDDAYDHVERMHGMLKLRPQFPNLHSRIQLVEGHLSNWEQIYGGEHV